MSLHPQDPPTVPEETRRVAQAAFRNGTLCMCIADVRLASLRPDALGTVYQDSQFASQGSSSRMLDAPATASPRRRLAVSR